MANIFHVERAANKITLGTTGTTINIASHTASRLLALDASKDLEVKAIGTDVQAWDAGLDSLAGLTYAAASFVKMTGADTFALRTIANVRTDLSITNVEDTALSTWAGSANITTLGTIATVGNITIADGGTIGQAAGPLLTFDDTNNYLEITGCKVGIGTATPQESIHLYGAGAQRLEVETTDESTAAIKLTNALGSYSWYVIGTSDSFVLYDYTDGVHRITVDGDGKTNIGPGDAKTLLTIEGTLTLKEQASADGDTATYGQDWVKNTSPCTRWFTDDDGNDFQLATNVSEAFSAYTTEDSESNAMLRTHAYKAVTDGFVAAKTTIAVAGNMLYAYVGLTDDPYIDGDLVGCQEADANGSTKSLFFAVAKDEYFEIRTVSSTPVIRWKSVGPLSKPVDQD